MIELIVSQPNSGQKIPTPKKEEIIMRVFHKFIFIKFMLLTVSCKNPTHSEVNRIAFDNNPAACRDVKFENETEMNLCALNEYGKNLLADATASDSLPILLQKHLAAKKIKLKLTEVFQGQEVRLRPGDECFFENSGLGYGDFDINSKRELEALRQQVRSTAEFLKLNNQNRLGHRGGLIPIQIVEICPKEVIGQTMKYEGGTLKLGVETGFSYTPITSDEIKTRWDNGEAFLPTETFKSKVKKLFIPTQAALLWKLANPIGNVQTEMRNLLNERGTSFSELIDKSLKSSKGESSIPLNSVKTERLLDKSLINKFLTLAPELKKFVLENWKCFITKPAIYGDFAEDLTSILNSKTNNTTNFDVQQEGFISIGNIHQINVDVSANDLSYANYFAPITPAQESSSRDYKVRQKATLLGVYTIDQIDVNLQISLGRGMLGGALETAGFENAMIAALNGQEICP